MCCVHNTDVYYINTCICMYRNAIKQLRGFEFLGAGQWPMHKTRTQIKNIYLIPLKYFVHSLSQYHTLSLSPSHTHIHTLTHSLPIQIEGIRVPRELSLLLEVQGVPGVIQLLDYFQKKDSYIYIMDKPPDSKVRNPWQKDRKTFMEP